MDVHATSKKIRKIKIEFQLVPPHIHRENKAERSIQTFKNYLKAGIASLNPVFPANEWDRLITQNASTLTLLRVSRANPTFLVWAYLFEEFDYMKTPLAPPGTKCLVHLKPNNRYTWSPNGEEGWTPSYSPDHYRYIQMYLPKTGSL